MVTTTTHKTLGGPRGGVILSQQELAKKINSAVFPGQQGGPLEHVIAAKAVAFKYAATEEFADRQARTLEGAGILATAAALPRRHGRRDHPGQRRHRRAPGARGPARLRAGRPQAEDLLHRVGITVNRNAVPFDPRPPMVSSGLRIGTPALATRGFGAAEFTEVADIIAEALVAAPEADLSALRDRVTALAERFPLYPNLSAPVLNGAL